MGKLMLHPPAIITLTEYKEWVKMGYGNLRGVKFVTASSRNDAVFESLKLS